MGGICPFPLSLKLGWVLGVQYVSIGKAFLRKWTWVELSGRSAISRFLTKPWRFLRRLVAVWSCPSIDLPSGQRQPRRGEICAVYSPVRPLLAAVFNAKRPCDTSLFYVDPLASLVLPKPLFGLGVQESKKPKSRWSPFVFVVRNRTRHIRVLNICANQQPRVTLLTLHEQSFCRACPYYHIFTLISFVFQDFYKNTFTS